MREFVKGMSNQNVTKENTPIRVIVAGLDYPGRKNFEHSMEEMESLVEACDMEAVIVISQSLPHPDSGS